MNDETSDPVDPEFDRSGIHVPGDIAESEGVPLDLDANLGEPFVIPSPERRKVAGWIYLVGAVFLALGGVLGLGAGMWVVAGLLAVLAGWHFIAAWPLAIDEQVALRAAARELTFPIGHASAAVRFAGWRSKPIWHVVLYDAHEPPAHRALVRVDAVDGRVLGVVAEDLSAA